MYLDNTISRIREEVLGNNFDGWGHDAWRMFRQVQIVLNILAAMGIKSFRQR